MTTPVLIDDHLLLRVLLDDEPTRLRPKGAALFTTGLWYHRLCRALADQTVVGMMSKRLGQVSAVVARATVASVVELPDTVGVISLRQLGWPMGELVADGVQLNLMSLEALAAAQHLGADICLAARDDNGPLRSMAARRRVKVRTITG